jgi:CRISPR/Cas system-associated protein Cas10 (large subunit of type III CRISPR-Cas system)
MGDGDNIREKVEFYLLNQNLEDLSTFSRSVTSAIDQLKDMAVQTMNAKIILAGGDDILLSIPSNSYSKAHIQQLQETFHSLTGGTISFGSGKTVEAAYLNLRRAKSSSSLKIVEEEQL